MIINQQKINSLIKIVKNLPDTLSTASKLNFVLGLKIKSVSVYTDCSGYLTNMTDSFTSPNYPDDYPNYVDCYYFINAPPDHIVQLNVEDFKTESCCDWLTVGIVLREKNVITQ